MGAFQFVFISFIIIFCDFNSHLYAAITALSKAFKAEMWHHLCHRRGMMMRCLRDTPLPLTAALQTATQ